MTRLLCILATLAVCTGLLVRPGSGATPDAATAKPAAAPPARIDFNRDVRPILSDKCFACHGPDAEHAKGGLRLDIADSAYERKKSGDVAIVPGKPDASALVERIFHDDPDELMPPPDIHKPLSATEKATLRRWIEQGGEYDQAWAYVTPKMTEPPAVKRADWPLHWIDRYILARLEAQGLAPAPDADRVTLIRRLSFDLTGLPPTPAEVDAFVNDTSADAYEKVVDRLLASPHYGERMAIWWLDLTRFADTVGYHGDQTHRAWPYRDYVIKALNENMPFDRFTREQLAGDLLENPTQDQRVATAYNRLLQTTHEGGAQLKEYRAIYMADRVRNVSQVFMGATVGCAQCHNHKYDPYSHRDFHTLGAFFADVDDEEHLRNQYGGGLNALPTRRHPEMMVLDDEMRAQLADLDKRDAEIEQRIAVAWRAIADELDVRAAALAAEVGDIEPTDEAWIDDGHTIGGTMDGSPASIEAAAGPVRSGKTSRLQTGGGAVQHVLRDADRPVDVRAGDRLYAWVHLDPESPPRAVMLQFRVGDDWNHRAYWGEAVIPYGKQSKDYAGYHRVGDLPKAGEWVRLEVDPAALGLKPGAKIRSFAWTQHAGRVYWDDAGVTRGQPLPQPIMAALNTPAAERTDKQRAALLDHFVKQDDTIAQLETQRPALAGQRKKIEASAPRVMVTEALAEPRVVRILPRGNWLDETGEIIQPAIPEFMGTLDTDGERATRLDLADWLTRSESDGGVAGLTARVQANRFWKLLMGVGIARVLDDFGGQGEPPVYPELLDRLALEFVDSGWDVKHMMKTIVMSRTYRQSSVTTPELAERDPDNRLYARQARPRLPAEVVRDNALAIAGLLNREIGGPSVNPYQPDGYYTHLNFPARKYQEDRNANQWRRGVYVHWQRQFLHPMMKAFDAPTREECTASRPQSNIPTQALVLLNDPTFVEAARAFAVRILREGGDTDASRLAFAFRTAVGRTPDGREASVLTDLLQRHREDFAADPGEAKKTQTAGLTKPADGLDPIELAAWTSVARTLLNLNETITRN